MLRKAGKCYYKVFCSFVGWDESYGSSTSGLGNLTTPEIGHNGTDTSSIQDTTDQTEEVKTRLIACIMAIMNDKMPIKLVRRFVNRMVEGGTVTEELFLELVTEDTLTREFGVAVGPTMFKRLKELPLDARYDRPDQHSKSYIILMSILFHIKMFLWGSIMKFFLIYLPTCSRYSIKDSHLFRSGVTKCNLLILAF